MDPISAALGLIIYEAACYKMAKEVSKPRGMRELEYLEKKLPKGADKDKVVDFCNKLDLISGKLKDDVFETMEEAANKPDDEKLKLIDFYSDEVDYHVNKIIKTNPEYETTDVDRSDCYTGRNFDITENGFSNKSGSQESKFPGYQSNYNNREESASISSCNENAGSSSYHTECNNENAYSSSSITQEDLRRSYNEHYDNNGKLDPATSGEEIERRRMNNYNPDYKIYCKELESPGMQKLNAQISRFLNPWKYS